MSTNFDLKNNTTYTTICTLGPSILWDALRDLQRRSEGTWSGTVPYRIITQNNKHKHITATHDHFVLLPWFRGVNLHHIWCNALLANQIRDINHTGIFIVCLSICVLWKRHQHHNHLWSFCVIPIIQEVQMHCVYCAHHALHLCIKIHDINHAHISMVSFTKYFKWIFVNW